jgi:hypothetical protein
MNKQDAVFKEHWEKCIAKGRLNFGLVNGLPFGLGIFIITNLFKLQNYSFSDVYFTADALKQLRIMLSAGVIGYPSVKWWINQSIYLKILKKEEQEGST